MAVVVAALSAAPAARAQDTQPLIDAVTSWANSQSLARLLPGAGDGAGTDRASRRAQRRAKAKRPTLAWLKTLRFKVSSSVAARNRQTVLDRLPEGFDPAVATGELDRITGVWDGFVRDRLGWRTNDVGDATATVLLMSYAAYHEVNPSRRASGAVRDDARTSMALDRRVRRRSDAQQQTAAEMLRYRLILLLADVNEARASGDATWEFLAKEDLRGWVRNTFGTNLDSVRTSARGLVPRR